jgi:hypothetical protein
MAIASATLLITVAVPCWSRSWQGPSPRVSSSQPAGLALTAHDRRRSVRAGWRISR